jgi:hypothetical protein
MPSLSDRSMHPIWQRRGGLPCRSPALASTADPTPSKSLKAQKQGPMHRPEEELSLFCRTNMKKKENKLRHRGSSDHIVPDTCRAAHPSLEMRYMSWCFVKSDHRASENKSKMYSFRALVYTLHLVKDVNIAPGPPQRPETRPSSHWLCPHISHCSQTQASLGCPCLAEIPGTDSTSRRHN